VAGSQARRASGRVAMRPARGERATRRPAWCASGRVARRPARRASGLVQAGGQPGGRAASGGPCARTACADVQRQGAVGGGREGGWEARRDGES
jgi:hypothetical protein